MIPKRKKPRQLSAYTRELLSIVDQYIDKTGDGAPDLHEVARWAHANGLMNKPIVDLIRIMARALAQACRQDYIEDENREPVRRRHAVRVERGGRQLTLWPKMENMTRDNMRASLGARRNGTVQDALQIERDKRYFNTNYNPGEPIEIDFNLNIDIEEHYFPTEYPDVRPEDGDQPDES